MRSAPMMLLLLMLAVGVAPTSAEEPVASFQAARWEPPPFRLRFAIRAEAPRRDYRWVGTAIAGTGLGIAAAITAAAACGNSEHGRRDCTGITVGVGLLGAAVGGTIGHFIGRAIPRH
jgi:hypothetical protein